MEALFQFCAIAGGVVLVVQFLAGTLGLMGEHDLDHGHDHDSGSVHDHDHDNSGASWFAGLLTFRTVTAGLTFFGLCGMTARYFDADQTLQATAAIGGGLFALWGVAQVMKGLKQLRSDGAARIERCIGSEAVVYLQIPANNSGLGKVTVTFQKRTMEYAAFTTSTTLLPTGSTVRVIGVRDASTVEVEPLPA